MTEQEAESIIKEFALTIKPTDQAFSLPREVQDAGDFLGKDKFKELLNLHLTPYKKENK